MLANALGIRVIKLLNFDRAETNDTPNTDKGDEFENKTTTEIK